MAERTGDFEWRAEGDEAEVVLYARDDSALARVLPAASLLGVKSPVYAVASSHNYGWIATSTTHAAPDLVSAPARGLLLIADVTLEDLGVPADELVRLLFRNLSEESLPRLGGAGVRRICEAGAWAAAEGGVIEEEDLPFFDLATGDPDALGRRALFAGDRDWDLLPKMRVYSVVEVLDAEAAESLGLEPENLVLTVESGAGELGRLAQAAHRERIFSRIQAGVDFDAEEDLPAAPLDSEEAADLLAAVYAGTNFADGRCALALYASRRALASITGELRTVASWRVGGFEERDGLVTHRRGLARIGSGEALVCGGSVSVGTGAMLGSAPTFGVAEEESLWPWEEAGLLERLANLEELEPRKT